MIQKLSRKIILALFGKIRKTKKELSDAKKLIKKMWKEIDYLKFSSDQYYKNWKECAGTLWNARKYIGELESLIKELRGDKPDEPEEEKSDTEIIIEENEGLKLNNNIEEKGN